MRWKQTIIVCLSFAALSASAQVYRCKDAAGKLGFSDRPCDTGHASEQLQRKRTPQEIQQEREAAYSAELRKQERRLAEQEREWAEQRQRAMQPQPAPVVRHSGNDWQKRNELRNAEVSASSIMNNGGKWDAQAEAQRKEEAKRRAAAAPPTSFIRCDPGFCLDNKGDVYHRAGPDFMTGPNGRVCHRTGTMWHCS